MAHKHCSVKSCDFFTIWKCKGWTGSMCTRLWTSITDVYWILFKAHDPQWSVFLGLWSQTFSFQFNSVMSFLCLHQQNVPPDWHFDTLLLLGPGSKMIAICVVAFIGNIHICGWITYTNESTRSLVLTHHQQMKYRSPNDVTLKCIETGQNVTTLYTLSFSNQFWACLEIAFLLKTSQWHQWVS